MNICMIGTGYVGLVTGVCLAQIGHDVTCVDMDVHKIDRLNHGEIPIFEPGLRELIQNNLEKERLTFSCNVKQAVENAKAVFVAVGTPAGKDGGTDLSYVYQAAKDIAGALNSYKVIIDKSTVPVGTAARIKKIIEKYRKTTVSFSVVSNPEFLREGSAIQDIFEGDRIIIGVDDPEAEALMKEIYQSLKVPIVTTDIVSSEMIKYASNAFLATKISFINEIANMCEKMNADVTQVAKGMGFDKRIGASFLNAGLGYGGSCFPKDVKALMKSAQEVGCECKILNAVTEVNESQREMVVEKVLKQVKGIDQPVVGVWGLAFKPNTDDIREAPSLFIINHLKTNGIKIKAYDPAAMRKAEEIMPDIEYCNSVYQACTNIDALLIATDWPEFREINLDVVKRLMKTPQILDGRNLFDPEKMRFKGFKYFSIGRKNII